MVGTCLIYIRVEKVEIYKNRLQSLIGKCRIKRCQIFSQFSNLYQDKPKFKYFLSF